MESMAPAKAAATIMKEDTDEYRLSQKTITSATVILAPEEIPRT